MEEKIIDAFLQLIPFAAWFENWLEQRSQCSAVNIACGYIALCVVQRG